MSIDTLKCWHKIVQDGDLRGLDELLSDTVVFYSPVVHTPQKGKMITTIYLTAASEVFSGHSFRYVREVVDGSGAVLEFEVEVDEVLINGVDMIRWNEQGQIEEFKVMVRPLKAITLIHQKMAEMLRKGR
jgi:hypothetical protein